MPAEKPVIAIAAALMIELEPVVDWLKLYGEFPRFEGEYQGKRLIAVVAGMGGGKARACIKMLATEVKPKPERILWIGLAGALDPSLKGGDLIKVDLAANEFGKAMRLVHDLPPARIDANAFSVVTMDRLIATPYDKKRLRGHVKAKAVDLETFHAAAAAEDFGIPMSCARAISDTADETLPRVLAASVDSKGRTIPGKAMRAVLLRPWLIPQAMRLGKASRAGCDRLAEWVMHELGHTK